MSNKISCPVCGGAATPEDAPAAMEHYRCGTCGHLFAVRVHYVEKPVSLGITVYKARVHAGTEEAARKNRMKVKTLFKGKSNFYIDDIDRQIEQKQATWDLGFYSLDEVTDLKEAARNIGLDVEFILT